MGVNYSYGLTWGLWDGKSLFQVSVRAVHKEKLEIYDNAFEIL